MSPLKKMHSFWHYSKENEQVVSVQLFLWAKGMCVTGHNSDGELTSGMAYSYENVYELRTLESLVLNEPLLADPTLVKNICMCVSRHIIIPQALMNDTRDIMDQWLQAVHHIEYDEDINTSHNNALEIDIIYPKKKVVRSILAQYFPERKSRFYIAPPQLLDHAHSCCAFIMMLDMNCSITIYKDKKLAHHSVIDWISAEDIILHVHQTTQHLGTDADKLQWRLGGVAGKMDILYGELSSYIPEERFQLISPEDTFKAFSVCE